MELSLVIISFLGIEEEKCYCIAQQRTETSFALGLLRDSALV